MQGYLIITGDALLVMSQSVYIIACELQLDGVLFGYEGYLVRGQALCQLQSAVPVLQVPPHL